VPIPVKAIAATANVTSLRIYKSPSVQRTHFPAHSNASADIAFQPRQERRSDGCSSPGAVVNGHQIHDELQFLKTTAMLFSCRSEGSMMSPKWSLLKPNGYHQFIFRLAGTGRTLRNPAGGFPGIAALGPLARARQHLPRSQPTCVRMKGR